MIEASSPEPVFMKNCFSVPSSSLVVILDVEAELIPPPPAPEMVVFAGSRDSNLATAESSFMLICLEDATVEILRTSESMDLLEKKIERVLVGKVILLLIAAWLTSQLDIP